MYNKTFDISSIPFPATLTDVVREDVIQNAMPYSDGANGSTLVAGTMKTPSLEISGVGQLITTLNQIGVTKTENWSVEGDTVSYSGAHNYTKLAFGKNEITANK